MGGGGVSGCVRVDIDSDFNIAKRAWVCLRPHVPA